MSNSFFQFKQFLIHQDRCAMKVTTDACLFGAIAANEIKDTNSNAVLDIGCGTGLLSLMIAQQNNAVIDAIEIDEAAYQQATENFAASPWAERLHALNIDALHFTPNKKYDTIISNPPFFENDLRSGNEKKNAAKHDTALTLDNLIHIVDTHLTQEGIFAVLLPYHRTEEFIAIAREAALYLTKKILVKQTPSHNYFRSILFFSRTKMEAQQQELIIKDEQHNYTKDFTGLLKDYYLYL
jgi:tRNA1Val (adenine37-N6)-methyltransferase